MSRTESINTNNALDQEFETPFVTRVMLYVYLAISFYEPYLNGVLGSITKYYIFALIGVALLNAKKVKIQNYHLFFVFWLAYKFFTVLWARDLTVFKLHLLSQIGMTALLVTLTAIPVCKKTIDGMVKTLWLSSVSIGFLSLFLSKPYQGHFEYRLVLNLFGQESDPNNQAAFLVVGIAISIYYLLIEKKYKIPCVIMIIINVYSLFLTGSRGGLVSLIVIVTCFTFVSNRNKGIVRAFTRLFLIALIAIVAYLLAKNFLPADIFSRLFDIEGYEGGSNRDVLWANVWELFLQGLNPIFGAGWGSYYGYNDYFTAVHNTFLAMLCDVGIFGSLLFFLPVIIAAIYVFKRKDMLPLCLLISGFIPAFFVDSINKRFFWNAIIILLVFYNHKKEQETKAIEYKKLFQTTPLR